MSGYLEHCREALHTYGKYVFATLKTDRHFNSWVAEEKSQDPLK